MEEGHHPVNATDVKELADGIRRDVGKAIVGQDDAVELMLIALLASGHILLEGPPGTAKTFLAQCFARVLGLDFGRIQFTPDLMPGDILGSNLFNFQTSQFTLTRGPIFCELLLADEINRTPPKTQAALLEAMQERAVTIDGETHRLPDHFMVIATQNPIEQQGVYPLPEAQLDRFLFKHRVAYPSLEEETRIVARHGARFGAPRPEEWGIEANVSSRTRQRGDRLRRADPDGRGGGQLCRRAGPRDPRSAGSRGRRLPARRGDAGRRRPRPRRARRPRLCHPRRRQGAGAAGAAPPRHPLRGGRDRGAAGRGRRSTG